MEGTGKHCVYRQEQCTHIYYTDVFMLTHAMILEHVFIEISLMLESTELALNL